MTKRSYKNRFKFAFSPSQPPQKRYLILKAPPQKFIPELFHLRLQILLAFPGSNFDLVEVNRFGFCGAF
ncbi:hypothetical protein V6N13_148219 [Hibiscus sabdariffa]